MNEQSRPAMIYTALRVFMAVAGFCMVAAATAIITSEHILHESADEFAKKKSGAITLVVGQSGNNDQLMAFAVTGQGTPYGKITGGTAAIMQNNHGAIPITSADQINGHFLIGTNSEYLQAYKAQIAEGRIWDGPYEIVAGHNTNLSVDQKIQPRHLNNEEEIDHNQHILIVVGKIEKTGTAIDNQILTAQQTLYEIHSVIDHDHSHDEDHSHNHDHHHGHSHDHKHNHDHTHSHAHPHDHHHDHDHDHDEHDAPIDPESIPHEHGPDTINYAATALLFTQMTADSQAYIKNIIGMRTTLVALSPYDYFHELITKEPLSRVVACIAMAIGGALLWLGVVFVKRQKTLLSAIILSSVGFMFPVMLAAALGIYAGMIRAQIFLAGSPGGLILEAAHEVPFLLFWEIAACASLFFLIAIVRHVIGRKRA